tara:strand:+ start:1610 stop:1870 length:261 start_codon:yes stop_codon:yes gene_type:complete
MKTKKKLTIFEKPSLTPKPIKSVPLSSDQLALMKQKQQRERELGKLTTELRKKHKQEKRYQVPLQIEDRLSIIKMKLSEDYKTLVR